jgi:EAL domain-containing protein (putative c-di-GMP-specific phosphodiesterase class I)
MFFRGRNKQRLQRASDRAAPVQRVRGRDHLLEAVIAHEGIGLAFQPQIEPLSGKVTGVEALARWSGVKPERLFARAAAAGLAERLSRLVQRKALRAAGAWEGPLRRLRLSINVLPEDLARRGYDQWLLDEVEAACIAPERLTVEITESALLSDYDLIGEKLARLREAGITIAVDDFGSGYANMAYLANLPLDALKIDRSLVTGISSGRRDQIVVTAMIRLARELGLKVIVEGVESTAQLALLAHWGCDLYQGFIGAGPLDEVELMRFVEVSDARAA